MKGAIADELGLVLARVHLNLMEMRELAGVSWEETAPLVLPLLTPHRKGVSSTPGRQIERLAQEFAAVAQIVKAREDAARAKRKRQPVNA